MKEPGGPEEYPLSRYTPEGVCKQSGGILMDIGRINRWSNEEEFSKALNDLRKQQHEEVVMQSKHQTQTSEV